LCKLLDAQVAKVRDKLMSGITKTPGVLDMPDSC